MIKTLAVRNFTVFPKADFAFGRDLNVIVGENGTGKSHLLKLVYTILATSWEEGRRPGAGAPTKGLLQNRLAEKLMGVFRPEALGRLARRRQGHERCDVRAAFDDDRLDVAFGLSTQSRSEVTVTGLPVAWIDSAPAFLPTRELLTLYPGFVPLYESHHIEFEETWRDTCLLLGAPLRRGMKEERVRRLLQPLEDAMEGAIELDASGRFYLRSPDGRMEMPLVAEGLRKLGMLARLVATGSLADKGFLFWDEPEANLNSRIVRTVARSILGFCRAGVQVFIATHSLFLLREIELLSRDKAAAGTDVRYFGLHRGEAGIDVLQGPGTEDIGALAALDEELEQSGRYLDPAGGQA